MGPLDALHWITVSFYAGRRLSDSVSVDYIAEIPKANAGDVTIKSDPAAIEKDVLAAVKSAEDTSGISYGVAVDRVSIINLANRLESAWTDAVTDATATPSPPPGTASLTPTAEPSPQPSPEQEPTQTANPTEAPAPEPTQSPVPETTPQPTPTPNLQFPVPSAPPTPAATPQSAEFVEGFSDASIRSASTLWSLLAVAFAIAVMPAGMTMQ